MRPFLRAATVVVGLGLLGFGVQALVAPAAASAAFGIPSQDAAWVAIAGLRDVGLGAMTFALLVWQPRGLRVFLPAMVLVPLGDILIVLRWGESVMGIAPHLLGVAALGAISFVAWRDPALRSGEGETPSAGAETGI